MLRFSRPSAQSFARVLSLSLGLSLLASSAPPPLSAAAGRRVVPVAGAAASAARRAEGRPGELLVRFRDGVAERDRDAAVGARGGRRRGALRGASGVERVEVGQSRPPELVAAELASLPAVEYAEPNYIIRGEQAGPADESDRLARSVGLPQSDDARDDQDVVLGRDGEGVDAAPRLPGY